MKDNVVIRFSKPSILKLAVELIRRANINVKDVAESSAAHSIVNNGSGTIGNFSYGGLETVRSESFQYHGYDINHPKVSAAKIIQTIEDLVEWLEVAKLKDYTVNVAVEVPVSAVSRDEAHIKAFDIVKSKFPNESCYCF